MAAIIVWVFLPVAALAETAGSPEQNPFRSLSIGTQSIGARYKFTQDNVLEESAREIAALGSDTLKIALTPHYSTDYMMERSANIHSLLDLLANRPSFERVMDMPFRNIQLWVYPFSDSKSAFTTGKISESEAQAIYQEIYELTAHLLKRYSGSGKTFFIGNWEGDWHTLLEIYDEKLDPKPEAIQGAIQWFNLREKAVADARRDTAHANVQVFFYIELNHVRKAMEAERPAIVNRVLPYIRTDFVSWSSYDVTKTAAKLGGEKGRALLFKALNYIEAHLPKSEIPGKRVFIGEYGFERTAVKDAERQRKYSASIMKWALEWGCPFVLYWELYCNEIDPATGQHRGFWLIDAKGVKQPVWFLHQEILTRARQFVEDYRAHHGAWPSQTLYNETVAAWIDAATADIRPK